MHVISFSHVAVRKDEAESMVDLACCELIGGYQERGDGESCSITTTRKLI
jgi:hypothetical protein